MNAKKLFLFIALIFSFAAAGFAQSGDSGMSFPQDMSSMQVAVPDPVPETVPQEDEADKAGGGTYNFSAENFPGFYDASGQNKDPYNIPEILRDIPKMWEERGALFKKVGADMKMDPYALAAYCVFESYNEKTHKFNTRHLDGVASGIASTQANDVRGGKVPGLDVRLPRDMAKAKTVLRDNPEYGLRFLSAEFKAWYFGGDQFRSYYGPELYRKIFGKSDFQGYRDLAKSFPRVAVPGWRDPDEEKQNYGTQAEYVSKAYVLYKAFQKADSK